MTDKFLDSTQLINGAAVLLSFYIGYKYGLKVSKQMVSNTKEVDDNDSGTIFIPDCKDYKMLLVVRNDLNMKRGKIAAQCGHAAVGAFQKAKQKIPEILHQWEYSGCAKIALKVQSEEELMQIKRKADSHNFITSLIRDAGRTQIEPNTKTVLAIGPALSRELDKVTGHLKLL